MKKFLVVFQLFIAISSSVFGQFILDFGPSSFKLIESDISSGHNPISCITVEEHLDRTVFVRFSEIHYFLCYLI